MGKASIFFIGLGHMGFPMAENLLKAGYEVHGYDLCSAAKDKWSAVGGEVADHLNEAAHCTICITITTKSKLFCYWLVNGR